MKRGFTLIELLAVIVILAIILAVAIPAISGIIDNSKINAYKNNTAALVKYAKVYLINNSDKLPINIGDTTEVTLDNLKDSKLLSTMQSPFDKSKDCNGYILVTKLGENNYDYSPNLNCTTNIASSADDQLEAYYKFDDFQEPTQNIVPNSPINTYPKIGNNYSTYNTNQYNSNTFFSIGTVESVIDNIVTLSSVNHPIYTYDVLTPQTTGGGLTAGVNYFIKKRSSNSFSIHAYNSSQDGSLGFAVHNSIINDQRVSINSTSFPTMWFGPAHLPNSALVKEIIPNCFSNNGITHECIRLHTEHKPEGDVDGMAYGVSPVVTAGKKYTFSFYYRASNQASVGHNIKLQLYTNGGWPGDRIVKTLNDTNWNRYEMTLTAPSSGATILYFWPSKGSTIDITEIQCEEKKLATPYTSAIRISTVKDYSGKNNNAPLGLTTTPSWTNNSGIGTGVYEFNGASNVITTNNFNLGTDLSVCLWAKPYISNTKELVIHGSLGTGAFEIYQAGTSVVLRGGGASPNVSGNNALSINNWNFICGTINNTVGKIYGNGKLLNSGTVVIPNQVNLPLNIGAYSDLQYSFNGLIDNIRIYKRVLSEEEINNIYNIEK